MSRHCTVCTHRERAEIDRRLLLGQVSLSALGREYHVSRDALRAHRTRHLDELIAIVRAAPEAWTLAEAYAAVQHIHQITMDVLDDALRGKVVGTDEHGRPVRNVSSLEVSRLLREGLANLELKQRIIREAGDRKQHSRDRRMLDATRPSRRRGSTPGQSRGGHGIHP